MLTPAAVRFTSVEPLLGAVDLTAIECRDEECRYLLNACSGVAEVLDSDSMDIISDDPRNPKLDWVICGGESGPGARPMHPTWARGLRDQCAESGVPFFFKQWGEWLPIDLWAPSEKAPPQVAIQLDGYEDYKQKVTVTPSTPVELGVINLVQKAGDLNLASPQSNVTYTLTGPNGYSNKGSVPDKVSTLPIGDYTLTATQGDWTLPSMPISITDHNTTTKEIRFPYAKVTITSTPNGATVRQGRTVLGTTPLTLPQVRPTDMHLTVDLPPYTLQTLDLHVADFATLNKNVPLTQGKDFIAASGAPMVWIADGGYWAAKYPFRQKDFEKVAGYNPSFFRGGNLPVESISWESATAFIQKLNDYEGRAGKLPSGFHYSLPSESQWDQFNADTDISTAALSSNTPLNSTQNVGYSAPNKYGLYDTLGINPAPGGVQKHTL